MIMMIIMMIPTILGTVIEEVRTIAPPNLF